MQIRILVLSMALVGCTASPSSTPAAPTDATASQDPDTDSDTRTDTPAGPVAWRSAWPTGSGAYVEGAETGGRLLTLDGIRAAGPASTCGSGQRFSGKAVLWLPPGLDETFLPAPRVTAALVERAAWRLAEVAPDDGAIAPGVEDPDPALHRGIRVRSVRKIRRKGPPFQVVLGERDREILVAITDRDAKERVGGIHLTRSSEEPLTWGVVPPADLDGDGTPELVIYGDGEASGFRAVLGIDLLRGTVTARSFEEHGPVTCPSGTDP